jgi:hyperosmotically inducible periplasmic protein
MKRHWTKRLLGIGAAMLALPLLAAASTNPPKSPKTLEEKVRHELVMLPWYGVFDNLGFQIADGKVILSGQVTRPTLKSDAENAVKRLEGVTGVENRIEVLPLSPFDDRVRLAVLRAVYSDPAMTRYGMGAQPSIRIIVENGNVTLEGVVGTEMDRNIANIRANQVAGVFSVTNNLRVVKS